MILFFQSFSMGDVGGGVRVLSSVLDHAPQEIVYVCTGFRKNLPEWTGKEISIPMRPSFGRLENTRFYWVGGYVEYLWQPIFRKAIREQLKRLKPEGVHIIPHTYGDFAQIHQVCIELNIPVHISIHDEFIYTSGKLPFKKKLAQKLEELWQNAQSRFVISEEMGLEYCRRYGPRPYQIHTDGVKPLSKLEYLPPKTDLRLFFMGMLINSYIPNFHAWMSSLELYQSNIGKGLSIQFTVRSGGFHPEKFPGAKLVNLIPYANDEALDEIMRSQHFLYLPLPFGEETASFPKFSLSTKMISYLASGVPIIYHGPEWSAASQYLRRNDAAIHINSNNPEAIAQALDKALSHHEQLRRISENAQNAARRDFDAETLRKRFWNALCRKDDQVVSNELASNSPI